MKKMVHAPRAGSEVYIALQQDGTGLEIFFYSAQGPLCNLVGPVGVAPEVCMSDVEIVDSGATQQLVV